MPQKLSWRAQRGHLCLIPVFAVTYGLLLCGAIVLLGTALACGLVRLTALQPVP